MSGVDVRAKTRVPGLSDVEYFAQSIYEPEKYIVPGFNPGMPVINKPPIGLTDQEILCVIAYLQTLGGTATVTLQTSHQYDTPPGAAPGAPGAAPAPAAASAPGSRTGWCACRSAGRACGCAGRSAGSRCPRERDTMKIRVVLAVAAVLALLRFRRANLLTWALAWWVGIDVLLRFGFTAPIPSSVISIYMGIVSIAILAYVSSSEQRREDVSGPLVRFMTEKRYTAFLAATVVAIPALAAANVYVQMSAPIQPPLFSRTIPSCIASRHHGARQDDRSQPGRGPVLASREVEPGRISQTRRERAPGLYRNCVFCHGDDLAGPACSSTGWTRSQPISPKRSRCCAIRFSSADFQGRPRAARRGGPWDTAMPAWEKFLKEDEIWDVILFLYDHTGTRPRAREEVATQ